MEIYGREIFIALGEGLNGKTGGNFEYYNEYYNSKAKESRSA